MFFQTFILYLTVWPIRIHTSVTWSWLKSICHKIHVETIDEECYLCSIRCCVGFVDKVGNDECEKIRRHNDSLIVNVRKPTRSPERSKIKYPHSKVTFRVNLNRFYSQNSNIHDIIWIQLSYLVSFSTHPTHSRSYGMSPLIYNSGEIFCGVRRHIQRKYTPRFGQIIGSWTRMASLRSRLV